MSLCFYLLLWYQDCCYLNLQNIKSLQYQIQCVWWVILISFLSFFPILYDLSLSLIAYTVILHSFIYLLYLYSLIFLLASFLSHLTLYLAFTLFLILFSYTFLAFLRLFSYSAHTLSLIYSTYSLFCLLCISYFVIRSFSSLLYHFSSLIYLFSNALTFCSHVDPTITSHTLISSLVILCGSLTIILLLNPSWGSLHLILHGLHLIS